MKLSELAHKLDLARSISNKRGSCSIQILIMSSDNDPDEIAISTYDGGYKRQTSIEGALSYMRKARVTSPNEEIED